MRWLAHRWTILLTVGVVLAVPGTAAAAGRHGLLGEDYGITDGSDPAPVTFLGASSDTQTVAFSSADPLSIVDHDGKEDLYVRRGGAVDVLTPLASPISPNDPEFDPSSVRVLPGGGVLFLSDNQLGGNDSSPDLFFSPDLNTPLVDLSDPADGSTDTNPPSHVVVSADGSAIAFTTQANLLAADTQSGVPDVYRYSGGTLSLVTTGSAQGTSTGISGDGSRVWFESNVAQTPCSSDSDAGAIDVYSSAAPFVTPDSPTCGYGTGGESAIGAVAGAAPAGGTVVLRTREAFTGADSVAGSYDLYAFTAGSPRRLTALNATEPTGQPAVVRACDGGQVLFTTSKALLGADQDAAVDLYRSDGTTTTLMSPGATGDVTPIATSADCGDAAYVTATGDLSIAHDGGTPKLISGGVSVPAGAPQTLGPELLFTTTQPLNAADADGGAADVYAYDRASGATWFVSDYAKTDARAQTLAAASADGIKAVVQTTAGLPVDAFDPDGANDLYRYTLIDDDVPPAQPVETPGPPATPAPAPQPAPTPAPRAAAAPARPRLTFTTRGLAVRRTGKTAAIVTRIAVACPAGSTASCTVAFAARSGRRAFASSKATIKAGKTATLTIKLSSKALRQLTRARRLRLAFTITARRAGGADVTRRFSATLRAPAAAKRR